MNHTALITACMTIVFSLASARSDDNGAYVSSMLLEITATLSTNYHDLITSAPREQRREVEILLTAALHRSYLLSQKLSPLLVSNDAAAHLVASRLAEAARSGPVESGLVEGTLRSALFDGNPTWALYASEAILTNTVYRFENKAMMLGALGGVLAGRHLPPSFTQAFIRVHECAARALAGSPCSLERELAAQAAEHLACSRNPLVAARGIVLAKELRASAATEHDRTRYARIIVKAEEPSRYAAFLEDLLTSPDDDIAWEAYYELRDLHRTNSVALRAWEAKWMTPRPSSPSGTNAVLRNIKPGSGN